MEPKTKQIISPSGSPITTSVETNRTKEREVEDNQFVSVIVKRTDETFRHPDDILEKAIEEGVEQLKRPGFSLFLSATAAGMILCFSVLAVAVMTNLVFTSGAEYGRVIVASAYPIGFVLCILSRTQLFTEHTATAVYPVLDGRSKIKDLLRLWCIVILGNMAGGLVSAKLLVLAEPVIHAQDGYRLLAEHVILFSSGALLVSAVLAGWLMALGAWIVLSTYSTLSQIVSIYMVTFVIGLGGLHHSIAGSIELFAAYFATDNLTLTEIATTIAVVLVGNLIGGSLFVAVLNYGHIRHSLINDAES